MATGVVAVPLAVVVVVVVSLVRFARGGDGAEELVAAHLTYRLC